MSNHLSEKQLIGYVHQTLTDAEREEIDQHLAECARCRTHLDDHESLQRRIQYGLANDLRKASASTRKSFAAIAPRLKRGKRLVTVLIATERLSVVGALVVIFVLVYGLITTPLPIDRTLVHVPTPTGAMFRGGPQRTGTYDTKPVPGLGETVWTLHVEQPIWTSPSFDDGTVYIANADGYIHALDSQTGQVKWKSESTSKYESFSSPVVADGVLYVGTNAEFLALDSQTGEEKWKRDLFLIESSPTVVDGVVYVGAGFSLHALDSQTGEDKWKFATIGQVVSSPVVENGTVYFGSKDKGVYALDSQTGQLKWEFETKGVIQSSPAVADGIVYVGGGDGYLYALDSQTGQVRWKSFFEHEIFSSSAVADGTVYFGCLDGYLYALNSQTGQKVWKFKTGGVVRSSPAVANGVVYFGSFDHHLYALDALTGEEIWKLETEGAIKSSPIVADGMVYFGSEDGNLYAAH